MALRVLLGDESSTIKKVFQLALQDFAVEVRPVNIGVDVVTVAQAFQPDIIFIDVLLQKKNGYDVSHELKSNAALQSIPVVLMWSGFMELDEDKFEASMANGQLEKPFDVGALRKLVADLVPKTSTQRLSQFLTFPKMPDLEERPAPPAAPPEPTEDEDFKQVSIPKMKKAGDEKFRLNMKPEELDPEDVPVAYSVPGEREDGDEFSMSGPPPPRKVATPPPVPQAKPAATPPLPARAPARPAPTPVQVPASVQIAANDMSQNDLEMEDLIEVPLDDERSTFGNAPAVIATTGLSAEQLEKIIRDQSADVIESVVWKVVPELAKQIIERELNKLLSERDSRHP